MPYNWFRKRFSWRAHRPARRVRRAWMIRKKRTYTMDDLRASIARDRADREASVFSVGWWRHWGENLQRAPWRLYRLFDDKIVDPLYKAHNRLRHGHMSGELADINAYAAGTAAMGLRYWHHVNYCCVDYRDPDGHIVQNEGQIPPDDRPLIDWDLHRQEEGQRYYLTERAVADLVHQIAAPLERYASWTGWSEEGGDEEYFRRIDEARRAWRLWARYFPEFDT